MECTQNVNIDKEKVDLKRCINLLLLARSSILTSKTIIILEMFRNTYLLLLVSRVVCEFSLSNKCHCPFGYENKLDYKGWWWNPLIEVCIATIESTATKLPKFDCFYPPVNYCAYKDLSKYD